MLQFFTNGRERHSIEFVKSAELQRGLSTYSFYAFCIEGNEKTDNYAKNEFKNWKGKLS